MPATIAFLNGRWVPPAELVIPVDDPGFLLGATVSERLRTFGGRVFLLAEHLKRLCHSLQIVGLDFQTICLEVETIVGQVAARGFETLAAGDDLGIVVFVTPPRRAEEGRRRYGTLGVYAEPLAFGDWAEKYTAGEHLVLSDFRQVPGTCWPTELKCRSRMHYFLADQQARRRDPSARALVLDQQGRVAEASTANVLLVRNGAIVSPLLDDILPGVSLGFLQELAREERIAFDFDELMPDDVAAADEVLLASTSPCVLPVCTYNGRAVSDGRPGPMFFRLIEAWERHVGVDIRRQAEQFADR
jgi:branched-chain amino acid aminotransferase